MNLEDTSSAFNIIDVCSLNAVYWKICVCSKIEWDTKVENSLPKSPHYVQEHGKVRVEPVLLKWYAHRYSCSDNRFKYILCLIWNAMDERGTY